MRKLLICLAAAAALAACGQTTTIEEAPAEGSTVAVEPVAPAESPADTGEAAPADPAAASDPSYTPPQD